MLASFTHCKQRALPIYRMLLPTAPVFLLAVAFSCAIAQEAPSEECSKAMSACEDDVECNNLLSPLAAACSTLTCQPQCRAAVFNLYQNRLGRILLKTDGSCVHGRDELRLCKLMPTGDVLNCGLAKLICETDLQCQSKYYPYETECQEAARDGQCSDKCFEYARQLIAIPQGRMFDNCTCVERQDLLCENFKKNVLEPCLRRAPVQNLSTPRASSRPTPSSAQEPTEPSASSILVPSFMLCSLLAARILLSFF